ncbi:hypothetical protein DFJ58DRAFT_740127 [Suillus subalutaceus]|uniref:uncharacterized protein n=1 Tax=Suillus subalutaceus TaxID=48586 RepID=UPI001B8765F0|nr:uncharacterized protein DFJ58DRAFT_740127 [Suillus subalutaceus]KAG1813009.1 hypothetical protein DFJ58DRAFT_740127 [Suillus subalutaceus]
MGGIQQYPSRQSRHTCLYSNSLGSGSAQFSAQPFSPQLPPTGAQPYSPQLPPSASQPYPPSYPQPYPPSDPQPYPPSGAQPHGSQYAFGHAPHSQYPHHHQSGTLPARSHNDPNSLLNDDDDDMPNYFSPLNHDDDMDFHSKIY